MPIEEESLIKKKPFIFSHSGQKIGPDFPAISIEDIAVSLGRIARFAGHTQRFWSVLQHSFVVADLLPEEARGCGLLHDGSEAILSDIPTPFKNSGMKKLEAKLLQGIMAAHLSSERYKAWKTNPDIWKLVKIADTEAFLGEIYCVGTKALRDLYTERCPRAEKLVRKYLRKYEVEDYLRPDGLAILDFIRKAKDYQ
jgi:5'-deoxynucleotidase YfbR-like HD superfamily hydrolase